MRRIMAPLLFVLLLTGLYFTAPCLADDLNDGIEADDGVQQYNETRQFDQKLLVSYPACQEQSQIEVGRCRAFRQGSPE